MNPIQTYAYLNTQSYDGMISLSTTYKPYFDQEGYMDDGESNDLWPKIRPFTAISRRLGRTGHIFEKTESEFSTDIPISTPVPEAQARLSAMAGAAGVQLIFNHAPFDCFNQTHQ